jgi:hypothetical protein
MARSDATTTGPSRPHLWSIQLSGGPPLVAYPLGTEKAGATRAPSSTSARRGLISVGPGLDSRCLAGC